MGNQYSGHARVGNSPYTRSGLAPPPVAPKSGSLQPSHRINDPMSLELHMADERVRAAGLSPAEREWRGKWIHDQHLHADEPIMVDAVHRQLNPIRTFYRAPMDWLYLHFFKPTFGTYYGTAARVTIPKLAIAFVTVQAFYYYWKYEAKDWMHLRGIETMPQRTVLVHGDKIDPALLEKGLVHPEKYQYFSPSFEKRTAILDVGQTKRPW